MAARDVQHVGRLAHAGHPAPQGPHQRLAVLHARAERRGAGREIGMVEVVGFDPRLHHGAQERLQRGGIVVHALQEHRLA